MAVNFTTSNVGRYRDVTHNINTSHMKYLSEDKSSSEIKYRSVLEDHIREFISYEQHEKKFTFTKTSEILRRNVASEYFNALKAAKAWSHLSTYAKNLHNQPWRSEFSEIKLYSGFYKHQIESHLSGAESILELMGYKRTGHRLVINGPINKERLRQVSLDTLKAMCECQILFNIYEELSKHVTNLTCANILKFRESYPGSAEQTIRGILNRTSANYCSDCCTDSSLRRYPPNYPQSYLPTTNGYATNFRDEIPYQCSNGHSEYVRTAKLIDLNEPFEHDNSGFHSTRHSRKSNIDLSSTGERYSRFSDQFLSDSCNSLFDEKTFGKAETRNKPDNEWDYVYSKLNKENAKYRPNYQLSLSQSRNNSRNDGVSEALNNITLRPVSEKLDNSGDSALGGRTRTVKKPNFIELNKAKVTSKKADRSQTWSCVICTYVNTKSPDVCEMCSKSRSVTEEAPLEAGGKDCPCCTLVNKKEAIRCEACGADLENSPTYV